MHDTLTSSTCRRCYKPPLIFPYRHGPKVGKRPCGLRWKRHIGVTEDLIPRLRSRRTIARVIVAIAQLACQDRGLGSLRLERTRTDRDALKGRRSLR
jgi:hypothetical protein